MIPYLVHYVFATIGKTWKIGGTHVVPEEEDIREVLDIAAAKLYDGVAGDKLEVGGLIVEKTILGYDVYAYLGSYK